MPESSTRFVHLPDLEITAGMNIRQPFPRHMHDSYCIGLVERGARIIATRGDDILISPGELFVLNPQQPHACRSTSPDTSYYVISIKPGMMQTLGMPRSAGGHPPFFHASRIVNTPLADTMRAVCRLAELRHDPLDRETQLVRLLTQLIATYSDCPPADHPLASPGAVIHQAREYIHACYAQKISLDDLADVCHLSPYHLQRTFVGSTGLSPHEYLVHIRIQHSKTLLRQGVPLADIAQDVGFVDQSHFTHSFKRVMGITPGYFAKQHQQARNAAATV